MDYPVRLTPDTNGTLEVSFPDLPWVHTFGDDEADALARAAEALDTAIDFLIRERRPIPRPSAVGAQDWAVPMSALVAAKIALNNEMVAQGVTKAELRRRLHTHAPQIDRLVDARHATRFDQLEEAFLALGRRLEFNVGRPRTVVTAGMLQTHQRAAARRQARKAAKR